MTPGDLACLWASLDAVALRVPILCDEDPAPLSPRGAGGRSCGAWGGLWTVAGACVNARDAVCPVNAIFLLASMITPSCVAVNFFRRPRLFLFTVVGVGALQHLADVL